MRKDAAGRTLYAPRDLIEFMGSPFAAWMSRLAIEDPERAIPDERTEEDAILQEEGERHEHAYLEKLQAEGRDVCTIASGLDAWERTLEAMQQGREIIYQAALQDDAFTGRADFLRRQAGRSRFGDWRYDVLDTKLAHSPRPDFLVQLCAYAEMLEAAQASPLTEVSVLLGTNEERRFRLAEFRWFYRLLRAEFLSFMGAFKLDAPPEPEPRADHGRWASYAERFFENRDHLVRVAGIRRSQIMRLHEAGISTVTDLSRTGLKHVRGISDRTFEGLRHQAELQVASRQRDVPTYRVLSPEVPDRLGLAALPPPSKLDVFFDMEGYPHELEGGLEYLFGTVSVDGGSPQFADWWAHDRHDERRAFGEFVAWAYDRWRRDPDMHVYHYAPYEVTALRKLMGRHGICEAEVDALLRNDVFTDLYRVVRQGVQIGTPSYSLKKLEPLYQKGRTADLKTAGDSIVAYHGWRARNEPPDWRTSPTLRMIRDYNRDDCESLARLCGWLRERQRENGISWIAPKNRKSGEIVVRPDGDDTLLARELLAAVPEDPALRAQDAERWRLQELLAHLCEFHRRERKVFWWWVFDHQAMTHEQLAEDLDCLGDLRREDRPPVRIKRSIGVWYQYDPDQQTKLDVGEPCAFAHDFTIRPSIEELDRDKGRILLKFGDAALGRIDGGEPPERVSLIPFDDIPQDTLVNAVLATAREWKSTGRLPAALGDLLNRRPARVRGHAGGPLVRSEETAEDAERRVVEDLDNSTLVIQGPPGSGKTTTAARMILHLLSNGQRVGVAANSHEVILNLLKACATQAGWRLDCLKVGGPENDELFRKCRGARRAENADAVSKLGVTRLVGGTAFFFARTEAERRFDTLFVDEAGQVSLANIVAMSRCASNLVLLGDQRQLAQPIQGSHPGESGESALDYYLQQHATIPQDMGLFLGITRRLHPDICRFISESFYEDRLHSHACTEKRVVRAPTAGDCRIRVSSGICHVPVVHEGNEQSSEEEAAAIRELIAELIGRERTDSDGRPVGRVTEDDILVVAPYNAQVRLLTRVLKSRVRVGTVDKFQGKEAAIVILSMCASQAETLPRGLAFLLSPNRLNVAISRAQSLAIVVGSPALARARASSLDEMRLLNLYARILLEGTMRARPDDPSAKPPTMRTGAT